MAQTESRIRLIFEGAERGVAAAAAKARAAMQGLDDDTKHYEQSAKAAVDVDRDRSGALKELAANLGTAGKWAGLFGLATAGGAAAVGAALPALGSLALGFGVVKLAMKANNAESQAFHAQLDAMKKPIQDLENTAGRTFLPGVTTFLKDSTTLFPIFDGAIGRTGSILGETAAKLGDLFKTSKFKADLDAMLRSSDTVTSAIGDSFVKLTGKLVEFGGSMGPAAEGFGTAIRDIEAGLEGFLSGLQPHAADFKSIFESVGSILRDVLPIVGQLAGELARDLAPILRDVAKFIHDNKGAISDWVPAIAAATFALGGLKVALGIKSLIEGVTGALKLLGAAKIGTIFAGSKLGDLESVGKSGGATWGKGFLGAIKPFVKGATLAGIGIEITKWTDDLLPKDLGNRWGNIGRGAISALAGVFRGAEALISPETMQTWFITPLGEGLNRASELIRGWRDGTGPTFIEWAASIGDSIREGMQSKLDEVVAFVSGLPGRIAGVLSGMTAPISAAVSTAWQALVDGTRAKIDEAIAYVSSLPGSVGGALAGLPGLLSAVASAAGSAFLSAISGWFNSAVAFVRGIAGQVAGAVAGLPGALGAVASSAGNAFSGMIRGGLDAAVGFVRGIAGQVTGAVAGVPGTLSGIASSAGNAFSAAIRGGLSAAVGFVRGIPGQIAGALGGVGGILVGAGRSMIDGLTAGMRSALGSALAFARSIASQIAAVKGPLPKDRKTLVPAGRALMQGLQEGMGAGLNVVLSQTSAVAGSVGAAATGGGGANPFVSGGRSVSPMRGSAQAAMPTSGAPTSGGGSGGVIVQFAGNTSDALATVIMQMIRTNKIQIKAA